MPEDWRPTGGAYVAGKQLAGGAGAQEGVRKWATEAEA